MAEDATKRKYCRFWKWSRWAAAVLLVIIVAGYFLLPILAERVIRSMMTDAGLEGTELKVADIGWSHAVIERVRLGDDQWSIEVGRVEVEYDVFDLLGGSIEGVKLMDTSVFLDLSVGGPGATVEDAGEGTDVGEYWYNTVVDQLNQVGEIRADRVDIKLIRDGVDWLGHVDLAINDGGKSHPAVTVSADEFEFSAFLETHEKSAKWRCNATVMQPERFMDLIELAIDYDGELIPEGISLEGATLMHTLQVNEDRISPLSISALLEGVKYDGGPKPVRMSCSESVLMDLTVNLSGSGEVEFSGEADKLSLPLDPSTDFELKLKKDVKPKWGVMVTWGDDPTKVAGEVKGVQLIGEFDQRPVNFDDLMIQFEMVGESLSVDGMLSNEGVKVPLKYRQTMEEKSERWMMQGDLELGPFTHDRPLPVLSALIDYFDDIEVAGMSRAVVDFSVGSHKQFQGKMRAELKQAEVGVADGMVRASGVNGVFELHLIPLPDDAPGRTDPSYYTFDFTAEKLSIDSKDALDFDLNHQADGLVKIAGKGHLGMDETSITGELEGLTLHGEKGEHAIDLEDMGFNFELKGDVLVSSGKMTWGGNELPFSYRHERKDAGDGWELAGLMEIKGVEINEPIANAVMFVDAMEGITIGGKVSMKMDFSMGDQKDFDAVLAAGIAGGTLTMADDGPVIEGLNGGIRLSPLKKKTTRGFHRITATKMKAFDMEMTGLRLDYQLLESGDIVLKNVAMKALGGQVWLDDFTLPGEDVDYKFKVRAKRLDIAQLAKLFPDFNGSISGRIDGLLPIENVDGEFRPGRGGMYLTPRSRAKLRYDAGTKFSAGIDPKSEEYKKMKMVEDSLRDLDLKVLSIRLFDPRDKDKALVLRMEGQATRIQGSPPIHLNINGFKPDDDTVDFFDLLLRHRDRLNFGL